MHDGGHVVVYYAAYLRAGDGAAVGQGMGHPDGVDIPVAELILKEAVQTLSTDAISAVAPSLPSYFQGSQMP